MTKADSASRTNYYLVLDLMPGASHNEILHAYNRAKNTYTTGSLAAYSLMDDNDNKTILEEIEDAYAVLGHPSKRREYDLAMGFHSFAADQDQELTGGYVSRGPRVATLTPRTGIDPEAQSMAAMPFDTFEDDLPPSTQIPATRPAPTPTSMATPSPSIPRPSVFTPPPQQRVESRVESAPATPPLRAASFEANPEFEKQIAECKAVDGPFLKAVRIYRQMTQEYIAQMCKLSVKHVIAVEEEDGTQLPQSVYLRGHVAMICRVVGLPDYEMLARSYVERMKQLGKLQKSTF